MTRALLCAFLSHQRRSADPPSPLSCAYLLSRLGYGVLGDCSQKGNWSSFRNEMFNGKPVVVTTEFASPMPRSGEGMMMIVVFMVIVGGDSCLCGRLAVHSCVDNLEAPRNDIIAL